MQKPGVDDFDEPRPALLDAAAAQTLRGEMDRYLQTRAGGGVAPASLDGPDAAGECSRAYAALPPGPQLYRALSSHVQCAERWLLEPDAESKLKGLDVLREVALCSVERARDKKLGIDLCKAYLLPRLDYASPDTGDKLSAANLLGTCLYVFGEAGADAERLQAYRLLLHMSEDENTRNATRLRIANIFESQGNFREAIRYLRGIDPEGAMGGARLLLQQLEKKALEKEKRTRAK